jgi:hypothetical protein
MNIFGKMNKSEKIQKCAHDVAVAQFAKNLKLKRRNKNGRLENICTK